MLDNPGCSGQFHFGKMDLATELIYLLPEMGKQFFKTIDPFNYFQAPCYLISNIFLVQV